MQKFKDISVGISIVSHNNEADIIKNHSGYTEKVNGITFNVVVTDNLSSDELKEFCKKEKIKFSDLELIFKDLKTLFEKRGFIINWKELEKQSLNETINALAMASPFSLEEKQVLLEAKNLSIRKNKIAEILNTYTYDVFDNTTVQ